MAYIGTEPKDVRSFGKAKFDYTATQGQTAFTGADDDGKTLGFTDGQIEVFVNGILMDDSDFSTSNGNTITLASAANLNDIISIVALQTDIPNSDYVPASGGTFTGAVTHSGAVTNSSTTTMTGDLTVDTNTLKVDSSNNRVGMGTASPSQRLHVEGTGNQFILLNNSSTNDGMYLKAGTGASSIQTNGGSHVLNFFTSGTERMKIDSSGRVTMPYQPSFRASNGVTTFSGSGTSFACSTVHHNIGSHYNTNGTFTAPVSAVYHFNYSVTPLGGGVSNNGSTSFRLNGTAIAQVLDYSAADSSTQSITVYMAANDTMEAIGRGANNGSWTSWSASQTTFSGHMVG